MPLAQLVLLIHGAHRRLYRTPSRLASGFFNLTFISSRKKLVTPFYSSPAVNFSFLELSTLFSSTLFHFSEDGRALDLYTAPV